MKRRDPLQPDAAGVLLLNLARPLAPLWRALGADPLRLEVLLRLRFLISARRGLGPVQNIKGIGTHVGMTLLVGLLLLPLLLMNREDPGLAMATGQGLVLFFMAFNMVFVLNEFLFDEAEGTVIRPCPVDERTALLARVVHGSGYLGLLAFALSMPGVLGSAVAIDLRFAAVFALATVLTTALALALFLLLCGLALRLVGPARFKSAIGWGQLGMLLLLYGFQGSAVPVMHALEESSMFQERGAWCLAAPPIWSTALYERLVGTPGPWSGTLALASVLAPGVLLWLALLLTRRGFLEAVGHRGGDATPRARTGLLERLGRHLAPAGPQRAGWNLLATCGPRDPRFRLRVFPLIALPLMFSVGALLTDRGDLEPQFLALAFLYLPIVGMAVLDGAVYSERFRAAWVFEANPVDHARQVWTGLVRLSYVATVVLPGLAFGLAIGLAFGDDGWVAVGTGFPVALLAGVLLLPRMKAQLPFSQEPRQTGGMEQMGLLILSMLILVACSPLVILASQEKVLGLGLGAACLVGAVLGWRRLGVRRGRRRPR